jgi:hypothetical protein
MRQRVLARPTKVVVDDKCGITACQKQNGTDDILRFSEPLDGLLLLGATFSLF